MSADSTEEATTDNIADPSPTSPSRSRRGLIAGMAAVGASAAAGLVLGAQPAGATEGDAILAGQVNTATDTTWITTTAGNGLLGSTSADGAAGLQGVDGSTGGGFGVYSESGIGIGVYGTQSGGGSDLLQAGQAAGVIGDASTAAGVIGLSSSTSGVVGTTSADGQAGVHGNDASASGGIGVAGASTLGLGLYGTNTVASGLLGTTLAGTVGDSSQSVGVLGLSSGSSGVAGITSSDGAAGISGTDQSPTGGVGATGVSTVGTGVLGSTSGTGAGVRGESTGGYGVSASGGIAPLYLSPATSAGAPTTGAHLVGELYVDKNGALLICVAAGSPGSWIQVAASGPAAYAQGAFCLLPNPIRLLDTRAGATDGVTQPGEPVTAATTLTLQVTGATQNSISVPDAAVAVIGNITAVNALGRGFLSLWPAGATQPPTSSLNFPATTSVANGVTVALSDTGQLSIFASQTTDVIFDATGFVA